MTDVRRSVLERYLRYDPDQDFNGSQGITLASDVTRVFGSQKALEKYREALENKVDENSEESNSKYVEILGSHSPKFLYNKMPKGIFKKIFGELKKEDYSGPEGEGMPDWNKMNEVEMWNYYNVIRKDLGLIKKD